MVSACRLPGDASVLEYPFGLDSRGRQIGDNFRLGVPVMRRPWAPLFGDAGYALSLSSYRRTGGQDRRRYRVIDDSKNESDPRLSFVLK
jgi:hypothetical protein